MFTSSHTGRQGCTHTAHACAHTLHWGEPHTVRTPNNVIGQRDYAAVAPRLPVLSGAAVAEKELMHILLRKQAPQVIECGLYLFKPAIRQPYLKQHTQAHCMTHILNKPTQQRC